MRPEQEAGSNPGQLPQFPTGVSESLEVYPNCRASYADMLSLGESPALDTSTPHSFQVRLQEILTRVSCVVASRLPSIFRVYFLFWVSSYYEQSIPSVSKLRTLAENETAKDQSGRRALRSVRLAQTVTGSPPDLLDDGTRERFRFDAPLRFLSRRCPRTLAEDARRIHGSRHSLHDSPFSSILSA